MSDDQGRRARITLVAAGLLLVMVLGWPLPRAAAVLAGTYGAAVVYVVAQVRGATEGASGFVAARTAILLVLILLVPVVFDPRTDDVFGVAKFTVLAVGTIALVATIILGWLRGERAPRPTDALSLTVVALIAWTGVATALSPEPRLGLVGAAHSYDGFFTSIALAALFLVLIDRSTPLDVRGVVRVLAIAAGGLVVAYGLIQLHDRVGPAIGLDSRWDWVRWGEASFRGHGVWSTLGNPNQLAAFLAALLPLFGGLAIIDRDRRVRALLALLATGTIVLLAYASSRGAWLAAAAGLVTFIVLGHRRLKGVARRTLVGATVVVIALGVGIFAFTGGRGVGGKPLLLLGEGSSAAVRLDLWGAALEMAADRPLVGFGPDNFAAPFAARAPAGSDPTRVADDAHNIFLQRVATTGLPGLVAFLAVIVIAAVQLRRGRRRLDPGENQAVLLDTVASALIATLVAAMFDVERIGLSFTLWILLAALVRLARAPEPHDAGEGAVDAPRWEPWAIAAAAAVSALALALAWQATAPHRADLAYLLALNHETVTFAPGVDREARENSLLGATRAFRRAAQIAPWEPTYLASEALFHRRLAGAAAGGEDDPQTRAVVLAQLGRAFDLATAAVELRPSDPELLLGRAEIVVELAVVSPCDERVEDTLGSALEALVRADPRRAPTVVALAITASDVRTLGQLTKDEELQDFFDQDELAGMRDALREAELGSGC